MQSKQGALPLWGHQADRARRRKAVEMLCWEVHHWSGLGPSGCLFCFKSVDKSCPVDWILCPQLTPAGFSQTYTWSHIFLCAVGWKQLRLLSKYSPLCQSAWPVRQRGQGQSGGALLGSGIEVLGQEARRGLSAGSQVSSLEELVDPCHSQSPHVAWTPC